MRHDYLNNTPLSEALSTYLAAVGPVFGDGEGEAVPVPAASGRYTAKPVYAEMSSPHYNASAMDGIAVKAAVTYGAAERSPVALSPERYVVVDTGDPLPDGTDAVVMIEDVHEEPDGFVRLFSAVSPWQNVRQVGEDLCMGDMIAPSGTLITPAHLGAFLAGGVHTVTVKKRPVFGIIPTGDEIVPAVGTPKKGEIPEFNSVIFTAELRDWGAEAKTYPIVPDKKDRIKDAIQNAAKECDAVLVLAGSSAGRDDYTADVCRELGTLVLHGLAAKPGKPAVLGIVQGKPLVGLPGYPVSAMVVMEQIVKPLIDFYYKRSPEQQPTVKATLTKKVVSSLKYQEFVRVTLGKVGDTLFAVPLPRGAGIITSVTKAAGILDVPQNSEGYEAGESVDVRLLVPEASLENTLVVTGSHDPLLDELADEVNRRGLGFTVVSSHVGSTGAFKAVSNNQAHLGATHLLDEETGVYNDATVKKYFPDGGAALIKGVGRTQGLMVAPGNPLGVRDVTDLTRCRFVNRQRGAGTRVLLDYLLKQKGIAPSEIDGYKNEKFTHTAVAASVAAGNADAGMGIYSAAKIYGLDFIPLWQEDYDFLVNERYLDDPKVKAFFEVLRSPAFAERLRRLGGYRI